MAKLYFRYGAMNSGKSTGLMQVAHNYEERGMKVYLAKPRIDTKGGDILVSRLGVKRQVDFLIEEEDDLFDLFCRVEPVDCILVDEVQFLTPKQIDELFRVTIECNIPVICYGLRTDFSLQGFPGSERLLLLAHSIEELKTICRCGKKAIFNGRKVNGEFVFQGEQVAIDQGGDISYESLCGDCYFAKRKSHE